MIIKLPKELYQKLLKHTQAEFPNEGCGLVAGAKTDNQIEVKEVYTMTNLDASAEHFTMDPKEQFAVVKEVRNKGYDLIGNYHSHPFTPSRPSEEDKRLAYDEDAIYFILSLKDEEPVLKAFSIKKQKDVTQIELELI